MWLLKALTCLPWPVPSNGRQCYITEPIGLLLSCFVGFHVLSMPFVFLRCRMTWSFWGSSRRSMKLWQLPVGFGICDHSSCAKTDCRSSSIHAQFSMAKEFLPVSMAFLGLLIFQAWIWPLLRTSQEHLNFTSTWLYSFAVDCTCCPHDFSVYSHFQFCFRKGLGALWPCPNRINDKLEHVRA